MFLEPRLEHVVDHAFDHRTDLGGNKLVLGLRGELRVGHLDRKHGCQPFPAIVAGQRDLLLAGAAARLGVAGDLAGQRTTEAGQMGAAVALRNVVGEAQHGLVVAVVPPQRAFDAGSVAFGLYDDGLRDKRRLVAVEIFDERLDAALVAHLLALLDRVAHVRERDRDAGIEEREFAQPVLQRGEIELGHGEGFFRRQKSDFGAAPVGYRADDGERCDGLAVAEFHEVLVAVAPDRELQRARKRVDHRYADAMQSAGHLVGVLVEFSAGVQLRHDDLGGGHPFALVDVGRNAAAIVAHGAGAVGIERDDDFLGKAGKRFVDGVVDDLVDHVMQARAVVGVADIHAGALAHGIEPLEHLDRFCAVIGGCDGVWFTDGFGHAKCSRIACGRWVNRLFSCTPKPGRVQVKLVANNILSKRHFSRIRQARKQVRKRGGNRAPKRPVRDRRRPAWRRQFGGQKFRAKASESRLRSVRRMQSAVISFSVPSGRRGLRSSPQRP